MPQATPGHRPVETKGRENVIVLVHGGGGNAHEMQPFADAIQPRMECIGLTLIGHGGRPIPAGYTLDDMADDLAANIRRTGLKQPFLFGYCGGAIAVLNLLTRYHGIAKGAVLLGPRYRFDEDVIRHYTHLLSEDFLLRPGSLLAKGFEETQGPRWIEVARNQRRMFEALRERPAIDQSRLAAIDCPVMVIGPTDDPLTTFAEAQNLVRAIPRAELLKLNGPAHPPQLLPYPQIADHTVRFFQSIG